MLNIGIFAPYRTDHERNIAFCNDTGVHHIVHSATAVTQQASDGIPSISELKQLVRQYADGDVAIRALTPSRISQSAFLDRDIRVKELTLLKRTMSAMGESGIPFLHLYLNVDAIEGGPSERARLWDGLISVYHELAEIAEETGVLVSTHHYHLPNRLLWNYETMSALLSAVQSDMHGVTYCQGKSQMAGDTLAEDILNYGDKIFMFHIRDVVTCTPSGADAIVRQRLQDIGYLEVPFGTGEVDMVGSIRALKQINYHGEIYPEHFPAIAGDSVAGLAWTIGYIRALDLAVEP